MIVMYASIAIWQIIRIVSDTNQRNQHKNKKKVTQNRRKKKKIIIEANKIKTMKKQKKNLNATKNKRK